MTGYIKHQCPYCENVMIIILEGTLKDEDIILHCTKCEGKYLMHFKCEVQTNLDSENNVDVYPTCNASMANINNIRIIRILNEIIKLYEEETNYFVVDVKRKLPKIAIDPGPVSDLEDYIIEKKFIPNAVKNKFIENGYKIDIRYDENYFRLRMLW